MSLRILLCAAIATSSMWGATSCRSSKTKKEESKDAFAWNRGFGDKKISEDVDSAVNSARTKMRNPDINLPPVDLSRASSVTYSRVRVGRPFVAMTFDDGPHPTLTPRLLDILKERNIRATFFVVAPNAKRHPALIQRMINEGHEVANHTVTHGNIAKMSTEKVRSELQGCHSAIVGACGVSPRLFRPPYGAIKSAQKVWINDEFGYRTVMWSVDPEDWKRPGTSVVANRLISGASNGAIMLAHDIHSPTIAAMPQALDGILAKGYRFVTVSQLISMEQAAPAVAEEKGPEGEEKVLAEGEEKEAVVETEKMEEEIPAVIPPEPLPTPEEATASASAR